jgi:hypothetical protein
MLVFKLKAQQSHRHGSALCYWHLKASSTDQICHLNLISKLKQVCYQFGRFCINRSEIDHSIRYLQFAVESSRRTELLDLKECFESTKSF